MRRFSYIPGNVKLWKSPGKAWGLLGINYISILIGKEHPGHWGI